MCLLASTAACALPDDRGYELVSPVRKNGNEAGAFFDGFHNTGRYAVASPDGNAILYFRSGPFGEAFSGVNFYAIGRRSADGWSARDALPRPLAPISINIDTVSALRPSAELSQMLFVSGGTWVAANPGGPNGETIGDVFSVDESSGLVGWLAQPAPGTTPIPSFEHNPLPTRTSLAGASPDLSTVYFTYPGTLLPADAGRAPYVEAGDDFGFYEWHDSALSSAGTRPDGSVDSFGAVPAADGEEISEANPENLENVVSEDGSRAFFVSPDPANPARPASDPPELYVREGAPNGARHSVLVSRSDVLPPVGGLPAAAPSGPLQFNIPAPSEGGAGHSYVYASPDGSKAFFASADQLTSEAPNDASAKVYEFDLESERLTYLPNVSMPIVSSSQTGSRFLFIAHQAGQSGELDLWNDGQITAVAQLPAPPETETNYHQLYVAPTRVTADGGVFVFETDAPVPGFNDAGGFEQIYRLEVGPVPSTICVSCPPSGTAPSGDANLSNDDLEEPGKFVATRGISEDGSMIFFDTPDPLVAADVNGRRDVYEWENGSRYLISSGHGSEDSFFLDNSASGGDVFFATADGLLPEDTDGAYDVYDARAGLQAPPAEDAAECTSDCQSPSPPTPTFAVPASMNFAGEGNGTPQAEAKPTARKEPAKKKPVKKRSRRVKRRGKKAGRKAANRSKHGGRR